MPKTGTHLADRLEVLMDRVEAHEMRKLSMAQARKIPGAWPIPPEVPIRQGAISSLFLNESFCF